MVKSRLPKYYEKNLEERLQTLQENSDLEEEDIELLKDSYLERLDDRENVIGSYSVPLKLATNLRLKTSFDSKPQDYLIPMVVTGETSVVANQSKANKLTREGVIVTKTEDKYNIRKGQLLLKSNKPKKVRGYIERNKEQLLEGLRKMDKSMVSRGGGAVDLETMIEGDKIRTNIYFDTQQAMGALNVTENCEKIGGYLESKINEEWKGVNIELLSGIVSNALYEYSLVKGKVLFPKEKIDELYGEGAADLVVELSDTAEKFSDRAVTYNKGIANSITALATSTGNEHRALEAAIHSYASKKEGKRESPLAVWRERKSIPEFIYSKLKDAVPLTIKSEFKGLPPVREVLNKLPEEEGDYIVGEFKMPIPIGTVGSKTGDETSELVYKILGIERGGKDSARKLAEIMAACGVMECFGSQASMKEGISKAFKKF